MANNKKIFGNEDEGGTGPSFWIILVIVSAVMVAFICIFVSLNKGSSAVVKKDTVAKPPDIDGKPGQPVPKPLPMPKKSYRKASAMSPAEYKAVCDSCAKAEEHLKYGRPAEAKESALKALASGIDRDDPAWGRAAAVINKVSSLVISSDVPGPEKESYTIEKGDSLLKIALDAGTTVDMLMRINGFSTSSPVIHPGRTLKVFKGNWRVEISKKRFKLYLYDGENLFKAYNIGLGRQDKVPAGEYEIDVKKKDPAWSKDGRQVPAGSPENILGSRWISLKASDAASAAKGLGIHGSPAPEEIGRENASGYVRLSNDDIGELYMVVPQKTTVIIED